ncbi:murein biosynthesis integral membrane protein MurJ [Buchnera aphidicola (Melanaphis sacchari)]|uniref:Probable lipid II flippase MurJ n=1 Tax=Buchnera aphidicola (Melanaphis sacchari) TaxID=2173854 RepID=A0A2U8DG31_9GAMM|nr:murein biosynthesis integral membrane protein MurJ [Buchnera aphidicola]AWH90461.1 murein biosynthesis integral membrane protein MurJ [Buchnera aphidicola (Melanaphis sacchari)]
MNILKSLLSLSIITLTSRILGFIRDLMIAHIFGASIFTDAFFLAFKIPNLLRQFFSEGIFYQSFVPILIDYKVKKREIDIQNLIASISGFIIFVLFIITIFGIIFSCFLISLNAPGFFKSPEKLKLSCVLLKIMFPYVLLVSLSSLYSSILNSWNYFSIPAISSILLNASIIIFSFFFHSYFHPSVIILAWSVIIGGFFQLFYQFPHLYKINMLVIPKINFRNTDLLKFLKKIGPSFLGVIANQVSLVCNTIFSSLLISGSISWMYYADRLIEFPIGMLGTSLGTILFTYLSKSRSKGIKLEQKRLLIWGFRLSLILSIPSSVVLFILAKPLIIVLFKYGKFTDFDVLMIAKALKLYSFGLVSFILVKILISIFYAYQEINIPMRISIIISLLTQLINPFLIFYFQHAGLALSFSISGWISFFLLYRKLSQKNIFFFKFNDFIFFCRLLFATFIMIISINIMLYFVPAWDIGSIFDKIKRLFSILFISGAVYLISLYSMGIYLLDYSNISSVHNNTKR